MALGHHRGCSGGDPARAEIVDALLRNVERRVGHPGFPRTGRVAEVVEEDHGPRSQVDRRRDRSFAEVLVGIVTDTGDRVQAKAVLDGRPQLAPVRRREAVPMAQVDDERCPLEGSLDAWPRRIGAEYLRDVVGPAARLIGAGVAPGPVRVGETADRTDDHDDLDVRERGSSDLHRFGHDHAGGDQRDGQVEGDQGRDKLPCGAGESHGFGRPPGGSTPRVEPGITFRQYGARRRSSRGSRAR